jgi:hypothetical protein
VLIFWRNFEVRKVLLRVGGMEEEDFLLFLESGDDGEAEAEEEEGFVLTGEWAFCAFSYFCLGGCCLLYVEKIEEKL